LRYFMVLLRLSFFSFSPLFSPLAGGADLLPALRYFHGCKIPKSVAPAV
jgi:hypothetical protein